MHLIDGVVTWLLSNYCQGCLSNTTSQSLKVQGGLVTSRPIMMARTMELKKLLQVSRVRLQKMSTIFKKLLGFLNIFCATFIKLSSKRADRVF